ncbi:hypothetical protein [Bradyrhizobium elkanii]|uniref:hypothetical protein n=1 Tax=Bradyrhizobium elkanii TaxID=29448 RepID=UPI002714DDEE|nr:hypothetical protein [Bradyrhizobium elkanii]WLB77146.1 hypothetical protein QIH83_22285 [Bradyrhizobium elkanii]
MTSQWIPLSQAYEHVSAVFFVPSRVEEELLRAIRATHVATRATSLSWFGGKTGEQHGTVLDRDFWRENNLDESGSVTVKWLKNSAKSARNTYNGGIEVAQAEGIEVHAGQLFGIWPKGDDDQSAPLVSVATAKITPEQNPAQSRSPSRPPDTGYSKLDEPFLEKMRPLVQTGFTVTKAAQHVAGDGTLLAGAGTLESKLSRLVRAYKQRAERNGE